MYKTALSENRLVACWEMLRELQQDGLCSCKRTLGHKGRSDLSWLSGTGSAGTRPISFLTLLLCLLHLRKEHSLKDMAKLYFRKYLTARE